MPFRAGRELRVIVDAEEKPGTDERASQLSFDISQRDRTGHAVHPGQIKVKVIREMSKV